MNREWVEIQNHEERGREGEKERERSVRKPSLKYYV
jgi:hypothetical protein